MRLWWFVELMQRLRGGTVVSTAEQEQEVTPVMSSCRLSNELSEVALCSSVTEPRRKVRATLFIPWKEGVWPRVCEAKGSKNSDEECLWGFRAPERRGGPAASQIHTNTNNSHNHIQPTTAGRPGRVKGLLSAQPHETKRKKAIVSVCRVSAASLLPLCPRLLPQLKLLLCLWLACYLGHPHTSVFQGNYSKRASLPACQIANDSPLWAGRRERKKRWKPAQSVVEKVIQDHSEGAQCKQAAWPVDWFPLNTLIRCKYGK